MPSAFRKTAKKNFERHLHRLRFEERHYLELGVWTGDSMRWMARYVLLDPKSTGTGVDTWGVTLVTRRTDMSKVESFARESLSIYPKVTLIKECSDSWLRRQPNHPFYDVIYVDANHYVPCVLEDLVLSWGLLKTDGLFVIDDYFRTSGPMDVFRQVNAFMSVYATKIRVLAANQQVILQKTGEFDRGLLPNNLRVESES